VCNHPHLSYAQPPGADGADLARRCGKLAALDRMLVKLHATGHRVLLFSTMTRLLDLLEAREHPRKSLHITHGSCSTRDAAGRPTLAALAIEIGP
jgi:SNF2 family DNA or RNA helicase